MSAIATALFGSPLALQIYLIAHARKSDIKISYFGWPVASSFSNAQQFLSEQESAKPNENATMAANTETPGRHDAGPAVVPTSETSTSVSYRAVGRGLYRREVTTRKESPERQLSAKVDKQEITASADESKPTPNLLIERRLEEIRSEPKRYALSAATASAISQSRTGQSRKVPSDLSEDPMYPPSTDRLVKAPGLWAGQPCDGQNMEASIEERKDSAAFMLERKLEHVKRISQARQPGQAACSWKESQCEGEKNECGEIW